VSYEAVVFDNDGVLVELPSRETLQRAMERTFRSFDLRRPTREDMRALVAGNTERIQTLCQRNSIDTADFCRKMATRTIRAQQHEFESGLRSLYDDVTALWDFDTPLGLVSDNQQEIVEYILRVFGLEDRFDTVYGCPFTPDGIQRMKPDPYYLNAALSDLGTRDALYVGDSACDVEAAANADIDSALLSRDDESVECETEPTHEIESLRVLPSIVS
jgi:phosphoglycolate phosphatase-like HAD superfamily hydrolase